MALRELPSGTVTLLFTDIEGSTSLLQELGRERYVEALSAHRRLLREAFTAHGGVEVEMQGDSFHFAFTSARGAVLAAAAGQRALAHPDSPGAPIRVRMGLHTGEPVQADDLYAGLDVHQAARVMSAGHGGQILLSERTASLVEEALPAGVSLRDLGEHRLRDLSRPQRLHQLVIEGLPSEFASLKTAGSGPVNLPAEPNRFIGRTRELTELTDLLRERRARILTLTGAGGTGKTRLALRAAGELVDSFPDGVFFVPLASLRDPELAWSTIAQSIGAQDDVVGFLRDRSVLLLLDNCEHLLDGVAELATSLFERCPRLVLLLTSRERLGLQAERLFDVPTMEASESEALFVERARAAEAGFEPDEHVPAICSALDGLPLAIELAAARARSLSTQAILARLDERLSLLTSRARDFDKRQRTLEATIAWSYDLLDVEAQRSFRAFSVFAGGCTLEAAEQVARADLDLLESLLDKSLLRHRIDGAGQDRYWMLATIREFAAERLAEADEQEQTRRRHAEFFLALAEALEPPLLFMGDGSWVTRLTPETDNLRTAIAFHAMQSDPRRELRLVGSLFRFWLVAGLASEGRRVAEAALARAEAPELSELRLRVLYAATIFGGRTDAGGDRDFIEERLELARRLGDARQIAIALNDLGVYATQTGDFEDATPLLEECRRLAELSGDEEVVAVAMANLADSALNQHDYARARDFAQEAIALVAPTGDAFRLVPQATLDRALLALGDVEAAAYGFRELLEPTQRLIGPLYSVDLLDGLAGVAVACGDAPRATRLLGVAHAFRTQHQAVPDSFGRGFLLETEAATRAALDGEAWEALFAEGAEMSLEEAIAYALAEPVASQ